MDKRTWAVAFIGTFGLLGVGYFVSYGPVAILLQSIPIHMGGFGLPGIISGTAVIMIGFVMPCTLTIIAKRQSFLWGLMPYVLLLIFSVVDSFAFHGISWSYLNSNAGLFILAAWIGSSGVGLVIRWLLRRAALKKSATNTGALAPVESNAWPPAPRE